jgi:hypothetical protein
MFAYTVVEVGSECDDLICLPVSHTPYQTYQRGVLTSTLLMNGIQ